MTDLSFPQFLVLSHPDNGFSATSGVRNSQANCENDQERRCYGCGLPIPDNEKAIEAMTGNAWKHFECWYDGSPFSRDPLTGARR